MLKKLTLALSLMFAAAFAAPAMAQDVPEFDPTEMEGVESGYGRTYMVDFEMMMSSPEAMEEMSEDMPLVGMVGIFTFEDEDAAQENTESFGDQLVDSAEAEGADLEKEELDLGNESYAYTGEVEIDEESTMNSSIIVVQEDEYIYFVMIIGGEEAQDMGEEWAEFMLDGDIGDADDVELSEDGTSTGGVFDAMPTADDEDLLQGMLPVGDSDLMEEGAF